MEFVWRWNSTLLGAAYTVITQIRRLLSLMVVNLSQSLDKKSIIVCWNMSCILYYYVHVVGGDGPDLMGRDWIKTLEVTLNNVLEKHSTVFGKKLECMKEQKQS